MEKKACQHIEILDLSNNIMEDEGLLSLSQSFMKASHENIRVLILKSNHVY